MAEILRLPSVLANMTEGTLSRWLKAEGDFVNKGEAYAEIETDKAVVEIESETDGRLARILAPAGKLMPVDAPIAVLAFDGEEDAAIEALLGGQAAATASVPEPAAPAISPRQEPAATAEQRDRIFASPLARRLAREHGVELAGLTGSGPRGRIMRNDVLAKAGKPAASPVVMPAAPAPIPAVPDAPHERIPHTQMRRTIARRLTEAKQTVPHFYLRIDCRMDALLKLRAEINAGRQPENRISVNDFIVKAAANALAAMPSCNVSWTDEAMLQWRNVDISVAVATEKGLLTPVVRQADRKALSAISAEISDLAARARSGSLKPEEYQGGSFTISNLGMYGVGAFAAIINPPQAAILAVGAIEPRMIVENREGVVADMLACTLSVDHRAIDGALGAQWLAHFKGLMENPLQILT